jgi:anti-sigma factor RsiW
MSSQHLSDEAVAAFADGVLSGFARDRAARHVAACAECAYAVAVQREAIWALRAAPPPPLPSGLVDRLRAVPMTTPIESVPTAVDRDGRPGFATFFPMMAAAFVPEPPKSPTRRSTASSDAEDESAGAHRRPRRPGPARER